MLALALCACYAAPLLLARQWSPPSPAPPWQPSLATLQANLARPRSWQSFLLTLGLPGALGIAGLFTRRAWATLAPLAVGLLGALALFAAALLVAYADGRFIWTAYPFAIPIAIRAWARPAREETP
jgi:hypothetical protein